MKKVTESAQLKEDMSYEQFLSDAIAIKSKNEDLDLRDGVVFIKDEYAVDFYIIKLTCQHGCYSEFTIYQINGFEDDVIPCGMAKIAEIGLTGSKDHFLTVYDGQLGGDDGLSVFCEALNICMSIFREDNNNNEVVS